MNKLFMNKGFRVAMMALLGAALIVTQLAPRYPSLAHLSWGSIFTLILIVHIASNHKWLAIMTKKLGTLSSLQQEKYFTMLVMAIAYVLVIATATPAINNILYAWYGGAVDAFYRLSMGFGIDPQSVEHYIPAHERVAIDRNIGNFHRWAAGVATGATVVHIYQNRTKISYFLTPKKDTSKQAE